jgi:hypothetical protein
MTLAFKDSAKTSLKDLNKALTTELRSDALAAGWPRELVKSLEVSINKLSIMIDYDERYAVKIEDLEYGTEDTNPSPVFRKFIDKHGDIVTGAVTDWSLNYLMDSGLIP